MKKLSTRHQNIRLRKHRRRLLVEPLERRRLLACTPSTGVGANGVFTPTSDTHQFALTSVNPVTTSNLAAPQTSATYTINGNLRNNDTAFTDASHGGLNSIGVVATGSGVVSSTLLSAEPSDANRQIDFSIRVVVGLGTTSFSYQVLANRTNAQTGVPVTGVSTTVCVNQNPNAVDDGGAPFRIREDMVLSGNVVTNDTDTSGDNTVDFDAATDLAGKNGINGVSRVQGSATNVGQTVLVAGGELKLSTDGNFTYDPLEAFQFLEEGEESLPVTFTYEISDGFGFDTASVRLVIVGINDPPEANPDAYSAMEDMTIVRNAAEGVRSNDTDPDHATAQLMVLPAPGTDIEPAGAGQLTLNADGSFTFVPADDFNGNVTFQYILEDPLGLRSDPATVTISLDSVIDRPAIVGILPDSGRVDDRVTNATRVQFFGQSEASEPGDPVRIDVFRAGTDQIVATAITDAQGSWTSALLLETDALVPDQAYSFEATATDSSGTSPRSELLSVIVDTASPTIQSDSLSSQLRQTPISEEIIFEFVESDQSSDPVSGFDIPDIVLTKSGSTQNRIDPAQVVLTPVQENGLTRQATLTGLESFTQDTGTYTLSIPAAGSGIADLAANPLVDGFSTTFAIDRTSPVLNRSTLVNGVVDSALPVPIIQSTSPAGATVSYAIVAADQQFVGFGNSVVVDLVDAITGQTLDSSGALSIPSAASDAEAFEVNDTLTTDLATGQHSLQIRLTDQVGNSDLSPIFKVFVLGENVASPGAPGTPVLSEITFIGATIVDWLPGIDDEIIVDQRIPADYTINIDQQPANILVEESTHDAATGLTRLKLNKPLVVPTGVDDTPLSRQVAWLRPWQMSFDKTTQTVWFTTEDGHRVGQFDPATGQVNLYDVSIPDANNKATTVDPHGVFFDFNTHLTPRVWLVYRNVNAGTGGADSDTPSIDPAGNAVARVSYLDVCPVDSSGKCGAPQLFTFDFANQAFEPVAAHNSDGPNHTEMAPVIIHDPRFLPEVDLSFTQDAAGIIHLDIDADPFAFSRTHIDGPHVPGEGHAHVYVDGVRRGTEFDEPFAIGTLASGEHEVLVTLQANNHAPYAYAGSQVGNSATIKINNQGKLAEVIVHDALTAEESDATPTETGSGGGSGGGGGTGGGSITTQTETEEDEHHDDLRLSGAHAVFVDTRGDVWITAEDSSALIHLDFDATAGGVANSLASNDGRLLVHRLPDTLARREGSDHSPFHIHGVQVVVDDQSGQQFVYAVDAGEKGSGAITGRLLLLIPGDSQSEDLYFEWDFDELLVEGVTSTGSPQFRDPHVLFTAIDDLETPGTPDDDQIIFGDPGFSFAGQGDGIVRRVDVSGVVARINERDENGVNEIDRLRASSDLSDGDFAMSSVTSIQIPAIPGTGLANSAPLQAFVDRSGAVFAADAQAGLMRFRLGDGSNDNTSVAQVPVRFFRGTKPELSAIEMGVVSTSHQVVNNVPSTIISTDRSQRSGVNQYEVAVADIRRSGASGPYRSALNAANTMYGSLSQSDQISTTVFAESARRQMAAVVGPAPSGGALTQPRMAFQVVRNGSLIMTARGNGQLGDRQWNLLDLLADEGVADVLQHRIRGDVAAMVDNSGKVHVVGRALGAGVVQFTFTPPASSSANPPSNGWNQEDFQNADNWSVALRTSGFEGHVLAEDPTDAGSLGFALTTADGQLLTFSANPASAAINRTANIPEGRVFSAVGTTESPSSDTVYIYGTNQTGDLVEYTIDSSGVSIQTIPNEASDSRFALRDTRLLRNVDVITIGTSRHVFGTDGLSRLVQWQIGTGPVIRENVSMLTANSSASASDGESYGYFPFQHPYTGRVYTYVEPLLEEDGTLRVYGTNGGDLIEFTRPLGGQWRVANLTQDTNATFGQDAPKTTGGSPIRVPANVVFGAPEVYLDAHGGRHILQINADGEVVEYYTFGDGLFPGSSTFSQQIFTQNINFFSGKRAAELANEIQEALDAAIPVTQTLVVTPVTTPPPLAPPPLATAQEDVNRSGQVTSQDALLIINRLNQVDWASGESSRSSDASEVNYELDVNRDGRVTALDALRVINYIASADDQNDAIGYEWSQAESGVDEDRWDRQVDGLMSGLDDNGLF